MKITTISVSSSRKLPNLKVDYASVSGYVSLTASLSPKDDERVCVGKLQGLADELVENHMAALTKRMTQRQGDTQASEIAKQRTREMGAKLAAKHEPF